MVQFGLGLGAKRQRHSRHRGPVTSRRCFKPGAVVPNLRGSGRAVNKVPVVMLRRAAQISRHVPDCAVANDWSSLTKRFGRPSNEKWIGRGHAYMIGFNMELLDVQKNTGTGRRRIPLPAPHLTIGSNGRRCRLGKSSFVWYCRNPAPFNQRTSTRRQACGSAPWE
jgi:hypothetical protein